MNNSNITYTLITNKGDPSTLQEACVEPDAEKWKGTMDNEIDSWHKNKTWKIVELLVNRNANRCKWIFEKKHDRCKEWLVVKDYAHGEGINFTEIFKLVVKQEIEESLKCHQ
ncbi:uncharacterized mitochondrial protein AtMg00820-like [Magnolia sinica]|uniref:uncharacterized mitochondrial protein AtMg00820-like n=1 Tax=Magnolia sinica TaxID=86752 RepID=UPI002658C036|nr:uncharacterized mitochondrial protein AtMg00820-like [Magnolia sinica]